MYIPPPHSKPEQLPPEALPPEIVTPSRIALFAPVTTCWLLSLVTFGVPMSPLKIVALCFQSRWSRAVSSPAKPP